MTQPLHPSAPQQNPTNFIPLDHSKTNFTDLPHTLSPNEEQVNLYLARIHGAELSAFVRE